MSMVGGEGIRRTKGGVPCKAAVAEAAAVLALLSSLALTLGFSVSTASADGSTPPPSTGATSLSAFPSTFPQCDDGINESDPLNLGTDDWQCDLPGSGRPQQFSASCHHHWPALLPNGSPVDQPFEVPTLRSWVTQPAATAAGSRITARRC